VVTFVKPTAVDVGGRAVEVSCDQPSGITYPVGTTTVTCTATIKRTDSVGNPITYTTGTTQFSVTVTPAAASGGGSSGGGASGGGTGVPSGGGSSGGGAIGGGTGVPGAGGSSGPTAGGSAGSTSGGSSGGNGTTGANGTAGVNQGAGAPTIAEKTDMTVDATTPRGATVNYSVTASDHNTAAQVAISCLPASGSTFELGPNGTTKSTTVTCRAQDSAGNAATPMSFTVTVVGGHDEIAAVEAQLSAAKNLSKSQKTALRSVLVRADRYMAAGAKARAKSQLNSFIRKVVQLPAPLTNAPTLWIQSARRLIGILG
jgi:hypothetical protein